MNADGNATVLTPTPYVTHGWVSQPDGRGTLDIIKVCVVTIFLCSWSVLALNVPEEGQNFILYKLRWMIFTILFPEVMTAIAAEQWRSALQTTEDFQKMAKQWKDKIAGRDVAAEYITQIEENIRQFENTPWSMRHSFFADMGGILLQCPDFPMFPVDGQQIVYLVKEGHLLYPNISRKMIWDKNKADSFARLVTVFQITWFFIQCIGRAVQRLSISTFELSTLAFIFCTVNTFFFWRHKPLDSEVPIIVPCQTSLADILISAGDKLKHPYSMTPLDFIKPLYVKSSLVTPFWVGVEVVFSPGANKALQRPVKRLGNSKVVPPRGITPADVIFALVFTTAYFGIHLVGWNFLFPSATERNLWRALSMVLLGLLILYLAAAAVGTVYAGSFAKRFWNKPEATTIPAVARLLPRWLAIAIHLPIFLIYVLARMYILVEGFACLRSLPNSVYETVDWWKFIPYIS